MRSNTLKPSFVRPIPDKLEPGILYISMEFGTAVHSCCCGCGREVITPLGPTEWKLIFDGKVSLHPSIGNWSFPCRSHYWIQGNAVKWAEQWSDAQIAAVQEYERKAKQGYYEAATSPPVAQPSPDYTNRGLWAWLKRAFP